MESVRLTAGQAIVRFMARQFVERDGRETRFIAGVWGIFGHGNVAGLGQALEELGDVEGMRYYRPQNEQAQVHLAAAFARHHDRLQTYACTSSVGPGALNMITAAAGATVNRIPVLLLPSDYFANRTPDPVLQQIEHPTDRDASANDAFRPVSRFFDRITRPEQLLSSLPEAFRVMTDPVETGAATISLPEDVQSEAFDWPTAFFDRRVWRIRRPLPEADDVIDAAARIAGSTSPMIVVGGGAIYAGATDELSAFSSRFGIPVVETQAGKGALPWNHPMNAGPVGTNGGLAANRLARSADLVIGIVNDAVGGHATVICAAGSLPGDLLRLWRPEDPKSYHVEYGFSCMGYEIVAGLGIKLADPERNVVVMVGDGSYLMMNSEIVTAVAEGLKVTIVVLDNHGFQCILALQRMVGVPDFGNELRFRNPATDRLDGPYVPVDFRAHAESMGALALHACTPDELRDALAQAKVSDRITVIVVPTEPEKRVPGFESWWDVPVAGASGQASVRDARDAYDEKRREQRLDAR